jgi:hypothetical protein
LLVSVPYALKAHDAETLGGKSVSDFVLAAGASPAASGANPGQTGSAPANNSPAGSKKGAATQGPTNFSGSTTDQIVGVTQTGTGAGVNATAPNNAVFGTATGAGGYAVYGIANGTGGIAVKGTSTNTNGTGVRGIETATTGSTIGVSAYVDSASGTAAVLNNAAGGKIISGQNDAVEKFSVDGSGNVNSVAGAYEIGGNSVVRIGNPLGLNLFLGTGAGSSNATGSDNVFSGYQAGFANSTGGGNVFSGYQAGYTNGTGGNNVFSGDQTGYSNTNGKFNAFIGYQAGYSNTTASNNTAYGSEAGYSNMTGCCNAFFGTEAGYYTSGLYNAFFGYLAGYNNTTGSSNLYIANSGPAPGPESNTIRIGTQGTGSGQQSAAYIAGIAGSTVTGVAVYVDTTTGQLGVASSSLRFKQQVQDMGDSTDALMKLRPVTFLYKPEYANGDRTLQYGLIAEEVAKIYPELVAYGNDGKPYTVRYQYLSTMLLNEVQKQYRRAESEANVIATQQEQIKSQDTKIGELEQRLSRLESLIAAPVRATEAQTQIGPASAEAQ